MKINLGINIKIFFAISCLCTSLNSASNRIEFKIEVEGNVGQITLSPDGEIIAFSEIITRDFGQFSRLNLLNLKNGELSKSFGLPTVNGLIKSIAFSPNQQFIAIAFGIPESYCIDVMDLNCGFNSCLFLEFQTAIRSISFSPNGQNIAVIFENSDLKVFNLRHTNQQEFTETAMTKSPGKCFISYLSKLKQLYFWDQTDNLVKYQTFEKEGKYSHVAFSPDCSRLLTCDTEKNICLWDTTTKECLKNFGQISNPKGLAISSDNTKIAICLTDKKIVLMQI